MASLSLTELKPGMKLLKDLHTPLGGVLLLKGTVLLPRDLEVIRAFMVQQVEIDTGDYVGKAANLKASSEVAAGSEAVLVSTNFQTEYEKLVMQMKSIHQSSLVAGLPMYELRTQLEVLIKQIKEYNPLTFIPRAMNEYDYVHHNAVLSALSSYQLAKWSGLPAKDWMQAAFAGLFHDIGNVKVDSALLYKPQPLTAPELEEMRKHTAYGYQILKSVAAINEGVKLAALQHHEKIDGTGYPLQLEGNQIHTYAKIVAITDIFHAMTLKRIYRKAQSPYLVLEQINAEAFGKLDPALVTMFIHKTTEFHNGNMVRLNNEQVGEIVFTDRDYPTRPMISVGGTIVNLVQHRQLYIEEVISSK